MAPKGVLIVAALACQAVTAFVPVAPKAAVPTCARSMARASQTALFSKKKLAPMTEEDELSEEYTEVDGIIFDGDFEDDSVKPSLTSLLEDVGDETFKLESDDSLFSIPDYVPTELPDLAALGSGLESKKELMSEFVDGELDVNDQKMYKLLGLDVLDEKKRKVNPEDIKLPAGFLLQELKAELAKKYRKHEYDTGSSSVQIAQLTAKVNHLTKHVQANPKDFASRRGLIQAVNQRRSLLNFVAKKTGGKAKAEGLAQELGIRYRASDGARSKFEKYRYFTNTKSKKAKNMQLIKEAASAN